MIRFDRIIYSEHAIRCAIDDYREIAQIVLTKNHEYYDCEIISSRYDREITCLEFKNYVLELTVKMGGQGHDI